MSDSETEAVACSLAKKRRLELNIGKHKKIDREIDIIEGPSSKFERDYDVAERDYYKAVKFHRHVLL